MAKIGFLEDQNDAFIKDVCGKLQEFEKEFLYFNQRLLPVSTDCRIIVDRLGYLYDFVREITKCYALQGSYVINNPFAYSLESKILDFDICGELGIPVPKTIAMPMIDFEWEQGDPVLWPDWEWIGKEMPFPAIMKPFNGFGWDDVYVVKSLEEARQTFEKMRSRTIMLLQEKIDYIDYYRAFAVGKKEVLIVKWNPAPFGQGRLVESDLKDIEHCRDKIVKWTLDLNNRIDFDFNAVEWCIDKDGKPFVIDAFNEVPDVSPNNAPQSIYWWIVDRFSEMVREKANSGEQNKTVFR